MLVGFLLTKNMYSDSVAIPSEGFFYDGKPEYLEVNYLTTEDELMMTAPALFNKGDALYKLLDKVACKPNNIPLETLLVNDKDVILLWLRENAYGNIIDNQDEKFYFNTHNIKTKGMKMHPDDGIFFTYSHSPEITLKIKLLTIKDEMAWKTGPKTKLSYYSAHIHSVNDIEDRNRINYFLNRLPIIEGRKIKQFIDRINFGVIKETTYLLDNKPIKTIIDMDELFFGYSKDNLSKINKSLHKSIFFLMNEGQGYTNSDILKMPTYSRREHEQELMEKIIRVNAQLKQN